MNVERPAEFLNVLNYTVIELLASCQAFSPFLLPFFHSTGKCLSTSTHRNKAERGRSSNR